MQVSVIEDRKWIVENHDVIRRPHRIVNTIGFKMSTLNDSFHDVHAHIVKTAAGTSIVPLCRWKGNLEVVGQFWSEGWSLAIPECHWDLVREIPGPVSIQYSNTPYVGMTLDTTEQAYLRLPASMPCVYYPTLFKTSNERRDMRQAIELDLRVDIGYATAVEHGDIDLLVELSVERIGSDSYLLADDKRESFVHVVEYLQGIGALRVMHYMMAGEQIGIAFLMYDRNISSLTFLSGFFRKRVNNFGKYMYWSFVRLAEKESVQEIIALAPLSRIKKDMRYLGRPLYGYEFDTTVSVAHNTQSNQQPSKGDDGQSERQGRWRYVQT